MSEKNKGHLKINAKTWTRDSHGLFDYEANTSKISILDIYEECKLIRKKNDIKYVKENEDIIFEERELGKISFEEDKILISNRINFLMTPSESNINEIQNKIWFVIKHEDNNITENLNSGMHELKLNDVIKLGRVKYVITELNLNLGKNYTKYLGYKREHKPVFQLVSDYKYFYFF
jgi:hypothetical protein